MSIKTMTLRGKLLTMTVTTVIALTALFSVLLINGKRQMLEDREAKVRTLVESTSGILTYYDKAAHDGQMSVEEAKKQPQPQSAPCATTRPSISGFMTSRMRR